MTDWIIEVDQQMFLWVQEHLRVPSLDLWMSLIRDKHFWLPLYVFIIAYLAFQNRKEWLGITLACMLLVGVSDQFSSNFLKKKVNRKRPCKEIILKERFTPVAGCSGGKSFPSSHATNHAALGMFFYIFFRRKWGWPAGLFILWPILIGFAQIYIGVHYPTDILAGLFLGASLGWLCYFAYLKISVKVHPLAR